MRRWPTRATLLWLLLSTALVCLGVIALATSAKGLSSGDDDVPLTYEAIVDIALSHDVGPAVSAVPAFSSERSAPAHASSAVGYVYDPVRSLVAPNSARIFRSVEPDELAVLLVVGSTEVLMGSVRVSASSRWRRGLTTLLH